MFPLASNQQGKTYVEDVFSSYVYTGTGASLTLTDNIDRTKGALDIFKGRSGATDWAVYDTARGVQKDLVFNSTAAETTQAQGVTAVSSTGVTIGSLAKMNTSSATYVKTTFRNAYNFFQVLSVTKTAGSNKVIDLSPYMAVPGMVKVKSLSTGSWYTWHRSLTAGKLLIGETTAAETTLGHITVSGTTLTLVDGVIADGTYHIEAYAHDTSADGMIQCGSFTTDGSGNATVTIGWEVQSLTAKQSSGAGGNWIIEDSMRGFVSGNTNASAYLMLNLPNAEGTTSLFGVTSTGFTVAGGAASATDIYVAIRRGPMRKPTSGAQVYNAIARTGTGAAATVTGVGFPPDSLIGSSRTPGCFVTVYDRLRGPLRAINTYSSNAESSLTGTVTEWGQDGISVGNDPANDGVNNSGRSLINYFFRRYPGVLDFFCDTGSGANKTEAHNLTVAPKFWFRKGRSGATQWVFGSTLLAATEKIVSPSPAGKVTDANAWNSTYPTATAFSVGTAAATNTSAATYITYLIGELAGVSKVFSYTGNGTTQTIDCGFAAGARLVLIVRTDAAGSFWIIDSTRGIVAGNDPALALDTTAAEVTSADALDPAASGFIVNQETTLNLNVNTATYIGFAIA